MKKRVISFLIASLFFFITAVFSQTPKIVTVNDGLDTMVMITQQNLATINSIILDREFKITELDLTKQLVIEGDFIIEAKDSIIYEQSVIIQKQSEYYKESVTTLNIEIAKEKSKAKWTTGIAGTAIGILAILLIIN